MKKTRVGFGFDLHRLQKKRKLFLGGVLIPYGRGLVGHSDADVLLHAICDALLGAMGKSDIGHYFPNSDPAFKNKASTYFIKKVTSILREEKYKLFNIDCVIVADAPNIHAHREGIKANIARLLAIKKEAIAIKAKTTEGILSYSRKGIAAYCVVLIGGGRK